jgi:predicted helicase
MEFSSYRSNEIIRFVSSPCSTGKTRTACQYIARHKSLRNHLYVAPSLKLLNETLAQLKAVGVEAEIISSETHPKRVKGAIIAHLKSALDCGHVLLITRKQKCERRWRAF